MFKNHPSVGRKMAQLLIDYKNTDAVIYALPKEGVIVAYEISKQLHLPLELIFTQKLFHPKYFNYAIGSVSETCEVMTNDVEMLVDKDWLEGEIKQKRENILNERKKYYSKHKPTNLKGKTVIIVDDGVGTGFSLFSAIKEIRKKEPLKIIVAIPVLLSEMVYPIKNIADDLIDIETVIENFGSVRNYYLQNKRPSEKKVKKILSKIWEKK